jgi:hypothetical protein
MRGMFYLNSKRKGPTQDVAEELVEEVDVYTSKSPSERNGNFEKIIMAHPPKNLENFNEYAE